jgi:hypothetical protein
MTRPDRQIDFLSFSCAQKNAVALVLFRKPKVLPVVRNTGKQKHNH